MADRLELDLWIEEAAVTVACESPCEKSKRGVVILRLNGKVLGRGFNHPPAGVRCTGDRACREACRHICVHAEMSALRDVGSRSGPLEVVHVKVIGGIAVPSGGPSCSPCARDLLDDGRVTFVWLLLEDGWRRYTIAEFYNLTMQACTLPTSVF